MEIQRDVTRPSGNSIYEYLDLIVRYLVNQKTRNGGKLLKFQGDTIKSYFPKSSNKNNFAWVKDFLECCLNQIESHRSLSKKKNHEGLPEMFYKVTADYEMLRQKWDINQYWNIIPPCPVN